MTIHFFPSVLVLMLINISVSAETPSKNNQLQQVTLTETVFLQQVKRNHPVLELAYLKQETASAQRLERQGAFDPVINASSAYKRFNSSADLGRVQEVVDSQFSMEFLTRYGVRIRTGVNLAIGDIKTPIYPTGEGGEYYIDMTLPLFRGAGINPQMAQENQAFLREGQTEHLLRQTELLLLPDALNHYWQWVGASKKREVERSLLEVAKFRANAVQQKIDRGLLANILGIEAEQEVQIRLGRLYKADRDLQRTALKLAIFLWLDDLEPALTPSPEQVPQLIANPQKYNLKILAEGKQQALFKRPEMQILDIAKSMAEIDQQLAQNTLLPQIDLFVTPGYQVGQGAIDGGVEVMAGVSMSLPIYQRSAKGQIEQARLAIENLSIQERQIIRTIMLEIADQFSAVNTTFDRYQAAEQELDLAQQLENGEKTRFEYGDSTLFLVNRRERATGEAKLGLIDVLVEYHQAVAGFQAATGKL